MTTQFPKDLLPILAPNGVDVAKLAAVLGGHFHSAQSDDRDGVLYPAVDAHIVATTGDGQQLYPSGRPGHALRLTYASRNQTQLTAIEPGPGLTQQDIDILRARVADELVSSSGTQVVRPVLFSFARPVLGTWRYRDAFQILPPPANAPVAPYSYAPHPFVLELAHRQSTNWHINNLRIAKALSETRLLLSCLLIPHLSTIGPSPDHIWALNVHSDEQGNTTYDSQYVQEGYFIDGMVVVQEDFTSTDDISPLPSVEPQTYFASRGVGADARLEVPANLTELLDRFYALPIDRRDQYLRACYWLDHAYQVHRQSRSASFMAIINAVEALNPLLSGGPKCDCCEQCTFQKDGPTKRFRDFLEQYGSPDLDQRMRNEIYKIRSDLSHGNYLLVSDQEVMWGLMPRDTNQRDAADKAWVGVRVALINWLRAQLM